MIQFPIVSFFDSGTSQTIEFARADGSATSVVILDDGWTPGVTKYVRDGRVTWSEVVEEMDCMTNTSTRDAALNLIESLNAMIHRAKFYLDNNSTSSVSLNVRSQFSTSNVNASARVLGPPDDGAAIIQLTSDFQTSPPGAIRFRLRFKRNGAWSVGSASELTAIMPASPWSMYANSFAIPSTAVLPTPISCRFTREPATGALNVKRMFVCVGVRSTIASPANDWSIVNSSYAHKETVASSLSAHQNIVLVYANNAHYGGASTYVTLFAATYAVFVTYRVRQNNVPIAIYVYFDHVAISMPPTLLYSTNSEPDLAFLGTVTLSATNAATTIRVLPGSTADFELGEIIFVELSNTSSIIELLSTTPWYANMTLAIENNYHFHVQRARYVAGVFVPELSVFDSLDIVMSQSDKNIAIIAVSQNRYTLVTDNNQRITSFEAKVTYQTIRTIIQ